MCKVTISALQMIQRFPDDDSARLYLENSVGKESKQMECTSEAKKRTNMLQKNWMYVAVQVKKQ